MVYNLFWPPEHEQLQRQVFIIHTDCAVGEHS